MTITRRTLLEGVAATALVGGLSGCFATNPATGRSSFTGLYSLDDDIKLGRQEYPKLIKQFGGAYEDRRLDGYVNRIVRDLAQGTEYPQFPYTVTVLNTPIANAMALPGGYVAVTRGLLALASNEAELAGVLSHELGHVNARHTAERLSQGMLAQIGVAVLGIATGSQAVGSLAAQGAMAFLQSYSRQQEFEADMLGVRYMSRSGYDPDAMVTFLSTLREQSVLEARLMGLPEGSVDQFNMMATHPRTVDRVKRATEQALAAHALADNARGARLGQPEYLAEIDGLMFGDDPEQGIVDGQAFLHPRLRFAFRVPEGFRLRNGQTQVTAQRKDGAAIVFDIAAGRRSRSMAGYIQNEWAPKARLGAVEDITVDGRPAATAVTQGHTSSGQVDVRLVAIDWNDGQVARFLFATPPNQTRALAPDLQRATYSFRQLSRREAANIKAKRLLVVRARRGDSVPALAHNLPYGDQNEAWFRMYNDMQPRDRLTPGRTVKVVAG